MYEYRNPYIIDFTNVKYYMEVHQIIKEALDSPTTTARTGMSSGTV